MRTPHAQVTGTVEKWNDEEGWGVLQTPDGLSVWCHYSQVQVAGHKSLASGTRVSFDYETPGQDGCDAHVLSEARPVE